MIAPCKKKKKKKKRKDIQENDNRASFYARIYPEACMYRATVESKSIAFDESTGEKHEFLLSKQTRNLLGRKPG